MKPNTIKILILSIFVLLAVTDSAIRLSYLSYHVRNPTTAQAVIKANIIPISSKIDGTLTAVHAHNFDDVKRGDILFEVDSIAYSQAAARAEQDLKSLKSTLKSREDAVTLAQKLVDQRQAELSKASKNAFQIQTVGYSDSSTDDRQDASTQVKTAQDQLEIAINQLDNAFLDLGKQGEAQAKVQVAEQIYATAKTNLDYAFVAAPTNGLIINLHLITGTKVKAQQELFSLVENNQWWVNATFKPNALKRIQPNQSALVKIDAYPNHPFNGVVESVNGNGVKIKILDPLNQNFSLSVDENCKVTIDTTPKKTQQS